MIRHLDLFSGVGGFALAINWLGHETVGFCEIDPWCRRVLDKHWPGVPQHDDIKTLHGDEFGAVDLVTGGFPCQPYSVAGKQLGNADDRALWPEMARVIAKSRPTYVLVENSPNIRNMVLDDIYDDLESLGYAVRAAVIPVGAIEAPHRRERMWVMAHLDSSREQSGTERGDGSGHGIGDILAHADGVGIEGIGERIHRGDQGARGDDHAVAPAAGVLSDTDSAGRQKQRGAVTGGEFLAACELNPWGSDPSGIRGMVHGLPDRMDRPGRWDWMSPALRQPLVGTEKVPDRVRRVSALGNAISPLLAYEILSVMIGETA